MEEVEYIQNNDGCHTCNNQNNVVLETPKYSYFEAGHVKQQTEMSVFFIQRVNHNSKTKNGQIIEAI